MTMKVGETIRKRYEIRQRIGAGGFGTTYLAWDTTDQRDVVIKESNTADDDDEQTMLLGEINILRTLKHPHLPEFYDCFVHEKHLCLVMQHIPGEDLSTYTFDPTKGIKQKIQWVCQVLEALSLLHQQQPHPIVHRDVKPDNIRIHEQTDDAYLIDFGIAKDTNKTKILAVSPPFSSPEQYTREGTTPASDVYSVGIILYWILTESEPPEAPKRKGPLTLPAPQETTLQKVYQIITKATDLDPQNRYTSAQEMLHELEGVQKMFQEREGDQTQNHECRLQRFLKLADKKTVAECEEEISQIKRENAELNHEISRLRQNDQHLTRKLGNEEESRKKVTQQIQEIEQQNKALRQENETLERSKKELTQKIQGVSQQLAEIEQHPVMVLLNSTWFWFGFLLILFVTPFVLHRAFALPPTQRVLYLIVSYGAYPPLALAISALFQISKNGISKNFLSLWILVGFTYGMVISVLALGTSVFVASLRQQNTWSNDANVAFGVTVVLMVLASTIAGLLTSMSKRS